MPMRHRLIMTVTAFVIAGLIFAAQAEDSRPIVLDKDGHPVTAAPVPDPGTVLGTITDLPEGDFPILQTADGLTTMPAAVKLPKQKDLHDLMEEIKRAHRKTLDQDSAVGLRAAEEVEHLTISAGHRKLRVTDDEYIKLLADLYWKNQELQKTLRAEPARPELMKAFQAQNNACNACHKIYRKEHDH